MAMTIFTSVALAQTPDPAPTQISSIEDLNDIRNDLSGDYVLTKNLDFAEDDSYDNATANKATYRPLDNVDPADATAMVVNNADGKNPGFTPIGDNSSNSSDTRFTGTLDGNGFTISNLYINTTANTLGLFGVSNRGAEIQNLGLLDVYIKGENTVGGLIGISDFGTIRNCYVTGNVIGASNVGGLMGSTYRGCIITNCYATAAVSGSESVGGLVGRNPRASVITNCYATGNVAGGDKVGGLVGENNRTIRNCYATGTVTGTSNVGGLVGDNNRGTITNSFWDTDTSGQSIGIGAGNLRGVAASTTTELQAFTSNSIGWSTNNWDFGTINQYPTLRSYEGTEDKQVQGLVICNQPATTRTQCNTTTPVLHSSSINFGEVATATTLQLIIVGRNLIGEITLSPLTEPFSYAAGQALTLTPTNNRSINVIIPIILTPTADYQTPASTVTISEGGLSSAVEVTLTGITLPVLADTNKDGLLEINYIEQLNAVRHNLDRSYELMNDLDFANDASYASGTVNIAYRPQSTSDATIVGPTADATNAGFAPIGHFYNPFKGTFEGNDFTISHLYINNTSVNQIGLFGYIRSKNNKIQNLGLLEIYVKGVVTKSEYVGGLLGGSSGTISNCYATGTVTGDAYAYVGGLVGSNFGNINNCYATATVEGTIYLGGLVGSNYRTIRNSYATGTVSGSNTLSAGGLVGDNNRGTMINCYATGTVSATGSSTLRVGGLVGWSKKGTIENCYATTGTVSATGSGTLNAGGLVGWNRGGAISNSYATGTVSTTGSSTLNAGGLVGLNDTGEIVGLDEESAIISNCFWDTQTTNQTTSAVGTGKTTIGMYELTATSTTWDTNNWDFGTTSQYPALRTYKEDAGDVQIQGDLFCGQPQPRTQTTCPLLPNADGIIEISTIEELNTMRYNLAGNYKLSNNLDFADLNSYASGVVNTAYIPDNTDPSMATNAGFPPIGDFDNEFTGTLEGNGFTISNLYVNVSASYVGLFGRIEAGGMVQNIGLVDAYVKGRQADGTQGHVGGLAGMNNGGNIRNCYTTGTAVSTATWFLAGTGGLVGVNLSGTIQNCYATVAVTGERSTGGLVGVNFGNINNCYATGAVTGERSTGGLVGTNFGNINNCFWNTQTSGSTVTLGIGGVGAVQTGVTNKTTAEMHELTATSTTWDTNNWDFGTNSQYPALRTYKENESDVQIQGDLICPQPQPRTQTTCPLLPNADGIIEISTIEELNTMRYNLAGNYKLSNNLDFADLNSYASGAVNNAYRPLDNTDPTNGSAVVQDDPANGENPGFTPIGDFGSEFTGTLEGNGFTISNLYVNVSASYVGLFGYTGTGSEVRNLGLLDVYVKGANNVGGLMGNNLSGTIRNCYATGTVSGTNNSVGGLVGVNEESIISNCYATATVDGADFVGGVVGANIGTIQNCYATGTVDGIDFVGGFVGGNRNIISNCYATGDVTGKISVGGLVAWNSGPNATITNSYFEATATDTNTGALTQSDLYALTATSTTWDTNNWDFGTNSQYPRPTDIQRK